MYFCKTCNLYFKYVFTSEQGINDNIKRNCLLCSMNTLINVYSDDSVKFNINTLQISKKPLICNYHNSYDVIYYVY